MMPEWMKGFKTLCCCRHDFQKSGITWGLFLSPGSLPVAVQRLYDAGFFLEDISGLDSADGLVAVYHFSVYSGADRAALYVLVQREDPSVPTISTLYSGARWHEREAMDFFGFHFDGHPDPKPLLLPEDMTSHPLLKGDKNRAPLKDLIDPGEIVERDPSFLFFEPVEAPADQLKPDEQNLPVDDVGS